MVDHVILAYVDCIIILYSSKFWWGKTSANRSFWRFGEKNVNKFTIANISQFSASGIWLGKVLENDVCFAKFAKVFPCHNFPLYGTLSNIRSYVLRYKRMMIQIIFDSYWLFVLAITHVLILSALLLNQLNIYTKAFFLPKPGHTALFFITGSTAVNNHTKQLSCLDTVIMSVMLFYQLQLSCYKVTQKYISQKQSIISHIAMEAGGQSAGC